MVGWELATIGVSSRCRSSREVEGREASNAAELPLPAAKRLCSAVAGRCGDDRPTPVTGVAVSILALE